MRIQSLSATDHILRHCPHRIVRISVFASGHSPSHRQASLVSLAKERGVQVQIQQKKGAESAELSVETELKPFQYTDLKKWTQESSHSNSLVLALDHIQDPQNFGAIARTAEGLGARALLLPKDRSVGVTPGVYHASVGAIETLPIIQVANLNDALRKLKKESYWIVGASLNNSSTPLEKLPAFDSIALVLGSEWEGLSASTEKECDWLVHIPLLGLVESLNVSASASILTFALMQRLGTKPLASPPGRP